MLALPAAAAAPLASLLLAQLASLSILRRFTSPTVGPTAVMPIFTRQQRKAWRKRVTARRIARLANVATTPAEQAGGTVLAIMLTSKPDPQRGEKISTDYAAYLKPWWTTVNRVGLSGV